jgi:glycosyltransferase involved in cell wall biosynthesis
MHLDRLQAAAPDDDDATWSLVFPRGVQPPALDAIRRRRRGVLSWQAWEQCELPWAAQSGVLVNLCNTAPLLHRRSVTMIHDAQVFLTPESYSRAFAAWYRFALPRIGQTAARIITVSNYSRDCLVEFGIAPPDRISVVPNGGDHLQAVPADPAVLDRIGVAPGRYVLAAAGAQKHKNVARLFEAIQAPRLDGLVLVVTGADDARTFAAAGAPPPRQVLFPGRISDGELRALYENALCLATPSTTEGFGLPPVEAMGLGCPTIAAPCGALPEVCGDAALYADAENTGDWVNAIAHLASDETTRLGLRQAGRQRASRYRWADSARLLQDIIREIAEDPPAEVAKRRIRAR